MDSIKFYRERDPYGYFSNFAPYPIHVDGKDWPTSEHYFQAQKFLDEALQERIRRTVSPMKAAQIGRDRSLPLRPDWKEVKDDLMYRAVHAKFTQHPELTQRLLDTGDAVLIEHTTNDSYWADAGDGSGKNMLGKILMRVREELRTAQ